MNDPRYAGWAAFDDDELIDNADYVNELRFGGDPRSDNEIKDAVYSRMDDDYDDPEWY